MVSNVQIKKKFGEKDGRILIPRNSFVMTAFSAARTGIMPHGYTEYLMYETVRF